MSYYERVDWEDGTPLSATRIQRMSDNTELIKHQADELRDRTDTIEEHLRELQNQLNKKVTLIHNCVNCGGQLNVEENKPVIHCKYCNSCYVIGTVQIYSTY